MAKADSSDLVSAISSEWDGFESPPPPTRRKNASGWFPRLTPSQMEVFNDPRENIVAYGPKASGKSRVCIEKLVRHCYENNDALAIIIGTSSRVASEGAGQELVNIVLPAWRDGNIHPITEERLDEGIGIQFTPWKLNPVTKDNYLWIQNRFGGWSKVLMMSIQYSNHVKKKLFGIQPSFIYIEELMTCEDRLYHQDASAQLGRRPRIKGPQQWVASMNPEGPSHWTYKLLYEECVKPENEGGVPDPDDREKPGICRDPNWGVHFIPFEENEPNLPANYFRRIMAGYRANPVEEQRMVHGKWIDAPDGEAIYKNGFKDAVHVRGNAKYHRGIVPLTDLPIIIGYDIGQVHTGISFLQCIESKWGPYWMLFDELCFYGERVPTKRLTRGLLVKMAYWCRRMETPFDFIHITDEEAITAYKPEAGSSTARAVQDHSRDLIREFPQQFGALSPIRMIGCPKPKDSVAARTAAMMDLLQDHQFLMSAMCPWHRNMFLHLPRDKDDPMRPRKPNKWSHANDSLTYPIYYRKFVRVRGFKVSTTPSCSVSVNSR